MIYLEGVPQIGMVLLDHVSCSDTLLRDRVLHPDTILLNWVSCSGTITLRKTYWNKLVYSISKNSFLGWVWRGCLSPLWVLRSSVTNQHDTWIRCHEPTWYYGIECNEPTWYYWIECHVPTHYYEIRCYILTQYYWIVCHVPTQ